MLIKTQKMLIPNIIINLVGVFMEHKDNIREDKKIIAAVIKHGIPLVIKNGSEEMLLPLDKYKMKKIVPVASIFIAILARTNTKRMFRCPYIEYFFERKARPAIYTTITIATNMSIKTP